MVEYKIGLIGFGGVNRALAELIATHNNSWEDSLGFRLSIVAVTDLQLGSVISPNGIDARMLIEAKFARGGFAKLSGGSAEPNNEHVIRTAPADIIVEATFTNPDNGEPAVSHCRWAFESGKHIVTTNKGPVAFAGRELKQLASRHGLEFEFEGSVMSGTPVLRLVEKTLAGSQLTGFEGILNGTSNFILGQIEGGLAYADAVKQAQALGYAEADPTADVEGFDVRLKVVILANQLLNANLTPQDVLCTGITGLTAADVQSAVFEGHRWKLIGEASIGDNGIVSASVSPKRLSLKQPLAGVNGATNAVSFKNDMLGEMTIMGPGAGRVETAYALLSDIIAIHANAKSGEKKAAA